MFLNAVSSIEPSITPEIWNTVVEFISKLIAYTMPAFLFLGVIIGAFLYLIAHLTITFIRMKKWESNLYSKRLSDYSNRVQDAYNEFLRLMKEENDFKRSNYNDSKR